MKSAALLLGAVALLAPVQASSEESWINRAFGYNDDGTMRPGKLYCRADGRCYRVVRANGARRYEFARYSDYGRRSQGASRVYSYSRRYGEEEVTCRDTQKVVGDQHLTVEGAKKAANDAWAGTIRFHYGEKFMDLNHAKRLNYTCSRSSIKEGGVATLGQTLTRCEVEAQPCHAPRVNDDEK